MGQQVRVLICVKYEKARAVSMGRVHPHDSVHSLSIGEDGLGLLCSILCLGHHPSKCVSLLPQLDHSALLSPLPVCPVGPSLRTRARVCSGGVDYVPGTARCASYILLQFS